MVRNPKLKLKSSAKLNADPTQRKLSFYLKKTDKEPSIPEKSVRNEQLSSKAAGSPKVDEIPPSPVTENYARNGTSFLLSRSRLNLFHQHDNTKECVPNSPAKRESETSPANRRKRLKFSPTKEILTSQTVDLNQKSSNNMKPSIFTKLSVKEPLEKVQTESILLKEGDEENTCDVQSASVRSPSKNVTIKTDIRFPHFSVVKTSPKEILQTISPNKKYTGLQTPKKENKITKDFADVDNSLDEFDFDVDLFASPVKDSNKVVPKSRTPNYTVKRIDKRNDGLLLTLQSLRDDYTRYCLLRGFWCNTLVKDGSSIAVISDFDDMGFAVIDNDKGFLIVNNDILISSTAITSTMFCNRKSVLAERFRGWDAGNQAMFLGNVIHDLFQHVVQTEPKSVQDLKMELLSLIRSNSYLHEAYGLGLTESVIQSLAEPYLSSIFTWIKQYCSMSPSPLCQDSKDSAENILVQVERIHDIEDNIWCTRYGVKGKVDLTVGVNIHRRNRKGKKLMPLELKTGKSSFSDEHKGQVILYSLMMADRLEDPGGGLLLYLSEGPKMKFIETNRNKERDLILLRNELAYYYKHLYRESEEVCVLPEPMSRTKLCQKCPFLLPCSLLESEFEIGRTTSDRKNLVKEATDYLSQAHKSYFSKWYVMLQQEYHCQYKKQRGSAFWLENATSRENKGMCISSLRLDRSSVFQTDKRFSHTFYKTGGSTLPSETSITVGSFIVVSSTVRPQICITMGVVTTSNKTVVTVLLDKDISALFGEDELYRIDINTSMTAFDTSFRNLLTLMQNTIDSEKLRKCIVDRTEPTFKKGLKRDLAGKLKPFLKVLNVAQQRAVLKLLMAEDYILLQGMPGTGKTATIVSLVQVLIALGFSVLLTSYTHSAVDNVLLRLRKCGISFVRLGQTNRIHPDIKEYGNDLLTKDVKSVEELRTFYNSVPVVATTCLSLNHPLFKQRTFDYCIVDEASQILQTACLGPLFHSKVFVLVGDSKQLTPVVNSKEAHGLTESLFQRLESPSCTFELNIQYRMNNEIMRICNELTYDGRLVSGSDQVANATLELKEIPMSFDVDWCASIFSAELKHSAIFLNTDLLNSAEVSDTVSVSNPVEAEIVSYLTKEFVRFGVAEDDMGIISFYRKQVQLLQQKLDALNVEVNTVDQYQGRDKLVVIVSCVRNNQGQALSDILKDERRLNVAITRAKRKLIIVGSQTTLQNYPPFAKLFKCFRSDQVVTLKRLPFNVQ